MRETGCPPVASRITHHSSRFPHADPHSSRNTLGDRLLISAFLATAATFIAQAPATSQSTQQSAPPWARFVQSFGGLMPIILVMVLFIWMTSRSRKKQEQQKQSMLDAMKRGDRVQTIGGILGNVVE